MAKRGKTPKEPAGPRFEYAPEEVLKLAARLIDEHHSRLAEAKISYVFRNGVWKKKGEIVDADAQVIAGVNRFEMDKNFRITINADVWNAVDEKTRCYILDKQLTRCMRDETASGEVRWTLSDYQVREFVPLITRYGLLTEDLRMLENALKQAESKEAAELLS